MSLLDITGLSHSYGDSRLYSDSALSLNRGEHMGIVGQNGTGKSTLIKICTEQVIPDSAAWPGSRALPLVIWTSMPVPITF